MFVVIVELVSQPGHEAQLHDMLERQARESLAEPGCSCFQVLGDVERDGKVGVQNEGKFLLYEAYDSAQAFEDHLRTEHTRRFMEAAGPIVRQKTERFLAPFATAPSRVDASAGAV